ncbi:MAG: MFS transporter, partial [Pseudomonadota bacterium]
RCFALWSFLISVFAATGPFLVGVFSESVFKQNLMLAMTTVAIPALSLSCLFAVKLFQRQSLLP